MARTDFVVDPFDDYFLVVGTTVMSIKKLFMPLFGSTTVVKV